MTRKRLMVGAAALVGLILVILVARPRHATTSSVGAKRSTAAALARATTVATPGVTAADGDMTAPVDPKQAARDKAQDSLRIYQDTLRYPLWSRPADGQTQYMIDWQNTIPIGQPFAADGDRQEIEAYFTTDRFFAGPGEAIGGSVEVFRRDDDTKTPIPVTVTGRIEYFEPAQGWVEASSIGWKRSGDQYVTSFVPSSVQALSAQPRETRVVARVVYSEEFAKDLIQPFRYAADAPFVVAGILSDAVKDGSLEVTLDVDVKFVAPVRITAALFDASGKIPIAVYDDWHRPETIGRQSLAITFFGKILRDKAINGPYVLRAMHGHVLLVDSDPSQLFWSTTAESMALAHTYYASQFSDRDFSSGDKDEMIRRYEDIIASGVP